MSKAQLASREGTDLFQLGHSEATFQTFDKAIQLDHNHSDAYYDRGYIYAALGQHQRAIQDFDKAIQLDPKDAMKYFGRGLVHVQIGQLQLAIKDFGMALQLDPMDAGAYSNRGAVYNDLMDQPETNVAQIYPQIEGIADVEAVLA